MDAVQFSHLLAQILLRLNARILSITGISVRQLEQCFPAKTQIVCFQDIFQFLCLHFTHHIIEHFNVELLTLLEIGFVDSDSRKFSSCRIYLHKKGA